VPPDDTETGLTHLLVPMFAKAHSSSLKAKALLRCAVVGLAAEQFRRARGAWPASPEEIPKGILPVAPLDPFDGKPLKYVRRPDGVTIYSVGPDEHDDGGLISDRPQLPGTGMDVGFRLYDPGARDLPPPAGLIPEPPADEDAAPAILPYPREVGGGAL
jgi:hypothetical protein